MTDEIEKQMKADGEALNKDIKAMNKQIEDTMKDVFDSGEEDKKETAEDIVNEEDEEWKTQPITTHKINNSKEKKLNMTDKIC